MSIAEYVRRTIEAAPPLTVEQRERLAALLRGTSATTLAPLARLDRKPPPVKKCALYRHYDRDGNLLYIGISVHPEVRRSEHARHSAFMEFSIRETVEWHDTTAQAEEAERLAIRDEAPLFNRVHARPDRDERLVAYCVERGAFHLLKPQ